VHDIWLLLLWGGILGGGALFCVLTSSRGLKTTYVRDLLHVGTGLWTLGLPYWNHACIPIIVVSLALAGILTVPVLARRVKVVDRFYRSVSDENETWMGIVLFVVSYVAFTALGLLIDGALFPAACAMGALSIGDGLGGFIGGKLGKAGYKIPWAKRKTYLGSLAVALGSLTAILIIAAWFNLDMSVPFSPANLGWFALAALAASLVEAVSPRSSDNLLVPAVVFLLLLPVTM
jgi:dolichol kinase